MLASRKTSGRACSWACSGLALLAFGCAQAGDTVIALEVRSEDPTLKYDAASVEAIARASLEKVGVVKRAPKTGDRRWQALVVVARHAASTAKPEGGVLPADRTWREVEAVIEIRALDKAKDPKGRLGRTSYQGTGWLGENVGVLDDDRELVERAIAKAGDDLATLIALEVASDKEIVAAVDGADLARASRAIEQVRDRHLSAAVTPLVALVSDPGPRMPLIPAAIGALVALKDPRSTAALIEVTKNRPPAVLVPIVFAVAEIGGREAQAWLFTVASGHPDREVRDAAKQALEELERKRPAREEPR